MSSLSIGRVLRSIFNGEGKPAAWALPLRVVESISAGADQTDSFHLACEEICRGLDASSAILVLNRATGPRTVPSFAAQGHSKNNKELGPSASGSDDLTDALSGLTAI